VMRVVAFVVVSAFITATCVVVFVVLEFFSLRAD